MCATPASAACTKVRVSALGRRKLTVVLRAKRGPGRNAEVWANTSNCPATLCWLRSFSAARLANSLTASFSSASVVTAWPKLRVQAICCFGGGACSKPMQGSPCSSRTVRSSTTPQRWRTWAVGKRAKSSTVCTPNSRSWRPIWRPTPHTSPTSVAAMTASMSELGNCARLHTMAKSLG